MATLLDIRTRLVEDTGHYELVVDAEGGDYSDNGADRLINRGQKLLDRLLEMGDGDSWLYKTVSAGDYKIQMARARIVKEVWVLDSSGNRAMLEKISWAKAAEMYPLVPGGAVESGTPLYWAPLPAEGRDTEVDYPSSPTKDILVLPPGDASMDFEVLAAWQSSPLEDDTDVSVWTIEEPELLVDAARYYLEKRHRNEQGSQEWLASVTAHARLIYHDIIAEEMEGPPEMFVREG